MQIWLHDWTLEGHGVHVFNVEFRHSLLYGCRECRLRSSFGPHGEACVEPLFARVGFSHCTRGMRAVP